MPLSWNEIRARAGLFSEEWKDASYEKGQSQTFYNEFFEVFGRRRRDVAVYEEKVKKLDNRQGFIDLFWPGHLLVEQKSAGRSLSDARTQATDYFLSVKEEEKPRYILLSDFQKFELLDLEENQEYRFNLSELADHIRLFGFVAGYHEQKYQDQDPVNIQASELMSNLHKRLEESGYSGDNLERLLVRTVFCLFADDTGIFQPDSFLRFVEDHTKEDGSDLGSQLIHLFEILDTDLTARQSTLDEDLADFPYVNGNLFGNLIRTPSFDREMREALLVCCHFNWSRVSPALFGSLFQTVMLPEEQRQGGAHYTSERNILKTIQPLFLDELREDFAKLLDDRSTQKQSRLKRFHDKLGQLTFFDPACGCGNFLILAYREIRLLEIEVLEQLYPRDNSGLRETVLDIDLLSNVDVDQFFGIEIEEFPARIAEVAMWLVDHQMNMRLSSVFGQALIRLPLMKSAHIHHDNALTLDWERVLPNQNCDYILGNPPFVGARKKNKQQSTEMKAVFSGIRGAGNLDYVAAWYLLASRYIQGSNAKVAFVSTNSITQGEQVGTLWHPLLNNLQISLDFAHRTFRWTIDERRAQGMNIASVYVVIIGFSTQSTDRKYIYEYETLVSDPHRVVVKNLSPYLVDASNTLILRRSTPISDVPEICFANMQNDGGHLLLSDQERDDLLKKEPGADRFIRPFVSAEDFISGNRRWCIWLQDAQPNEIKSLPCIYERVQRVKKHRLQSKRPATNKLASTPWLFGEIRQPKKSYLLIPKSSSESRPYIPIALVSELLIASEALLVEDAQHYHFGVLTSEMHMDWMRLTAGRIKSDYRYSNTVVYNNFPWPEPNQKQIDRIEQRAKAVLDARTQFPESTLADLYDPNTMPLVLLNAHRDLDREVEGSFRKARFKDAKERVEYLLERYEHMTAPLFETTNRKVRRKSR